MNGVPILAAQAARRGWPAAAVLALALTAAAPATSPALAATLHPAQIGSPDQADHWGFFFGDKNGGDGDVRPKPTGIGLPGAIAQLGTSNSTQYALLTDGSLWAWGQGAKGELGDGGVANSFTTPVRVQFPPGVRIASIPTDAMPYDTGLAVDTSGHLWGWGLNRGGELCIGNKSEQLRPVEMTALAAPVTAVAGADEHLVAVANGTAESCGANTDGVSGDGQRGGPDNLSPVRVSGLSGQRVVQVYSAFENAGALTASGQYYDWGMNQAGQLGTGKASGNGTAVPARVNLPDSFPVAQAAQGGSDAGNGQTIVMLADGTMWAWGNDADSQLGDGRTGMQASPERIFAPAGVSYATVACGGATCYGVTTGGDVYAWGANDHGEVGDGTRHTAKFPVLVDSGAALISATAGDVVVAAQGG